MNQSSKIEEYAAAILGAKRERSESACGKIADRFEDDLLEFSEFPDEYFDFVLQLFSKVEFYSKPGIWNFFLVLGTEKEKLMSTHLERLAQCILDIYRQYTDEDLCLAVCDFIARNYTEGAARELLTNLKVIEGAKPEDLRGFAEDGLRILQLEVARAKATLNKPSH